MEIEIEDSPSYLREVIIREVDGLELLLQPREGRPVEPFDAAPVRHQVADVDLAEEVRGKGVHLVVLHLEVHQRLPCLLHRLKDLSQGVQSNSCKQGGNRVCSVKQIVCTIGLS